jgi:uncharacterized membrane protein YfcA
MQNFTEGITTDVSIYLVLAFLTFLNIIIPLSGSATQTPLIAALTGDSHYAITISSWLLMISCAIISFVFRKDIRKDYLWKLLPMSIVGSIIGALLLIQLPNWLVTLALFILSVHFLYKTSVHLLSKSKVKVEKKMAHHLVGILVGLFSGFLQGTGLSGASVRASFLYSEHLKIEEVRGTSNVLNFVIFATASLIRFNENQLSFQEMFKWTIIFAPILFISIYLGRKVLIRLSGKVKDSIIILTMTMIIIGLAVKGIEIIFK